MLLVSSLSPVVAGVSLYLRVLKGLKAQSVTFLWLRWIAVVRGTPGVKLSRYSCYG